MDQNGLPMNNNRTLGGGSSGTNAFSSRMNFFPGNFVNQANDINPALIPGDGTLCLFPQSDYQAIYAKQWTNNGLISVRYIPENSVPKPENENASGNTALLNEILYRLDGIEKKMNSGKRPYSKPKVRRPEGGGAHDE